MTEISEPDLLALNYIGVSIHLYSNICKYEQTLFNYRCSARGSGVHAQDHAPKGSLQL